jgi:hypothetical protein
VLGEQELPLELEWAKPIVPGASKFKQQIVPRQRWMTRSFQIILHRGQSFVRSTDEPRPAFNDDI